MQDAAAFVQGTVVAAAQQYQVVQVGGASVDPVDEVMAFAPGGRPIAAGVHTPRVTNDQGAAQRGVDGAGAAPDVEDLARAVGDDPADAGIARQAAGGLADDGAGGPS